tara:strand:- start:31 stop:159 length:129 start_codon:yes stop_codon:yes gene_type:complete
MAVKDRSVSGAFLFLYMFQQPKGIRTSLFRKIKGHVSATFEY